MATYSSILAWRIPWTEAWRATVHEVAKSWTRLSNFHSLHYICTISHGSGKLVKEPVKLDAQMFKSSAQSEAE